MKRWKSLFREKIHLETSEEAAKILMYALRDHKYKVHVEKKDIFTIETPKDGSISIKILGFNDMYKGY